jgi:glutamate 5-kinase
VTEVKRVVVKVGSSTLTDPAGGLDRAYVQLLTEQIATLREKGIGVVLVSSGAIAAGLEAIELEGRPSDMPTLQAAASVGQVLLLEMYAALFASHGIPIGQVLLTRHDTADREAYLHARDTMERSLCMGIVPIVNENDTVAVDEIRFGDNDTLAALVATMIKADLVVLLTDIDGLYDADPRSSEEARLVEHVDELTDQIMEAAGESGTAVGSGGMATKLEAAKVLMKAGIPSVICDGRRPDVVVKAVEGEPVGTYFAGGAATVSARKLWIALGRRPAGEAVIDDGARDALCERGKSLLPIGVVSVIGAFGRGDAIVLKDRTGRVIARGLTSLSSAELEQVKGLKSTQIAEEMPEIAGAEVVHRDHLVIL